MHYPADSSARCATPVHPPAEAAIEAVAADVAPELGVCVLRSSEECRRMSAAAAHAYEMQSGPCAPELCPPVGNTGITGLYSTPDFLTSGVKK